MKRYINSRILFTFASCASLALAGGLWNETNTPISGEIQTWDRSPRIEITAPVDGYPVAEITMERAKRYPDGTVLREFLRRNQLNSQEYIGAPIPLLNPETGETIRMMSVQEIFAVMYSMGAFAEAERVRKEAIAANPNMSDTQNMGNPIP